MLYPAVSETALRVLTALTAHEESAINVTDERPQASRPSTPPGPQPRRLGTSAPGRCGRGLESGMTEHGAAARPGHACFWHTRQDAGRLARP